MWWLINRYTQLKNKYIIFLFGFDATLIQNLKNDLVFDVWFLSVTLLSLASLINSKKQKSYMIT